MKCATFIITNIPNAIYGKRQEQILSLLKKFLRAPPSYLYIYTRAQPHVFVKPLNENKIGIILFSHDILIFLVPNLHP